MDATFVGFLLISIAVIITPGPDTALTIRNSISGDSRAGLATAAGVATGQLIWSVATSLGLVGLLLASEPLFQTLRWAGALYLIYLGVQTLRAAWSKTPVANSEHIEDRLGVLRPRAAYLQGVINDLANPKMAAFFASVLPQFVIPGPTAFWQFVALGAIFSLLTLGWLALYVCFIRSARTMFQKPRVRRTLDSVAGVSLVGLGVRVALSDR
ncbi:MAG: LysE family translocator [Fimbriimonadaceae bacterium]